MCREKAQNAIDVLRNRGVRAQRLNLERGRAENAAARTAAFETRDPSRCHDSTRRSSGVEAAKITGLAQRAIERRNFTFANRLIVLAGDPEIRRAQQGYCRHPRKVRADE